MNIQTKMFLEREFRRATDSAEGYAAQAVSLEAQAAELRKQAEAQRAHAQGLKEILEPVDLGVNGFAEALARLITGTAPSAQA
jgi:regulator of protease activity HflC (stomatin/prohibitin superfamily)